MKDKHGSEMPNWTIDHEDMLSVLEAANRLMSRSQGLVYLGKLLKETSEPGTGEQIHQLLEALAAELEEYLDIIVPLVASKRSRRGGARQEEKGPG